jgi:hypothetical protein
MTGNLRRAKLWAAALAALAGLTLLLACYRPRTVVGDDWTPERLRAELGRNGLAYEGRRMPISDAERHHDGPDPGYYLRRPDDGRSWEDLASTPRAPELGEMRGFVVITEALSPTFATPAALDPQEGRVQLGRLVLHGDPAELRRILEALGYPVDPPRPDGADPWDFSRRR